MAAKCEHCRFRACHDKKPGSVLGRIWRWHINHCPGWKAYFLSQPPERQAELRARYNFEKYEK